IGGGNTAIDCARTALRNGAAGVTVVYRRTREEMPAETYEVDAALVEGVEAMYLTAPNRIEPAPGGGLRLHCLRMVLGEPDRSGRRRPVPVDGGEIVVEADTVIGAIGQSTDTGFLFNDLPVRLNTWGDIDVDGTTMRSSEHKVFAGGDCVTGPATVIAAVAAGRRAAAAMDELVTRGYVRPTHEDYTCARTTEDIGDDELAVVPRVARTEPAVLALAERTTGFAEVESTLDEEQARAEARRCLRCACDKRYDCALREQATRHQVVFEPPLHVRPYSPVATDHPFIMRDDNKCIACGRCVAACAELEGVGVLAFQFHQGQLRVATHNGEPLDATDCVSCGQCVRACPCGALDYRRERGIVHRAINDPGKTVVGFVAPAVRTVIATTYGLSPHEVSPFIAGLMRAVGFDKVFDFAFAADLTVVEEATEFLGRVERGGVMPQFTSCCPGWVDLVKRRYPALMPHLSTCRSPQQMMGATVKSHFAKTEGVGLDDLFVVSIVPCMAKKTEATWPELEHDGIRDVDAVITSTELLEMVLALRLRSEDIEPGPFDAPYAQVSGAGMLFGASGGVAIAAMRMAAERLSGEPLVEPFGLETLHGTEQVRSTTVSVGGRDIRVAVVSGLGNAAPLVEQVIAGHDVGYDLIEVMACPGGCINGAGNPVAEMIGEAAGRQQVLVGIDQTSAHRTSQTNPDIARLYDEFYGEPGSALAHELLHTQHRRFRV
ncbi:MAG: iron hydrogenase small subunit, partial [Micrococcales bacterium]|nr:iron hydrogenase small subunit [Micrococcales bacterium]